MEDFNKKIIKTIILGSDNYPELLKEIYDPPAKLFFRGDLSGLKKTCLAIVGSRACSYYGRKIVQDLVPALIKNDVVIVSGLARGIDCLAQEKTIAEGGLTIGVLGSGIDNNSIYPKENLKLAEEIINRGGAIISEFYPGFPPQKQNFPKRNRIISGLTKAVLIVEAGEKSGSLITARCALEQGREVLSVPGNIGSPASIGTNNLIKLGARPVTCVEDVLEALT